MLLNMRNNLRACRIDSLWLVKYKKVRRTWVRHTRHVWVVLRGNGIHTEELCRVYLDPLNGCIHTCTLQPTCNLRDSHQNIINIRLTCTKNDGLRNERWNCCYFRHTLQDYHFRFIAIFEQLILLSVHWPIVFFLNHLLKLIFPILDVHYLYAALLSVFPVILFLWGELGRLGLSPTWVFLVLPFWGFCGRWGRRTVFRELRVFPSSFFASGG